MQDMVDIFRKLKNPDKFGLVIGEIKADLPNIKIDIGNGIILDKDDLVFSASILEEYERTYQITSADAQLSGVNYSFSAVPFVVSDTLIAGANPPTRPVLTIPESPATAWSTDATSFNSTGTIKLTDGIKTGDKVALIAMESQQIFYVIEKVVSF